MQTKVSAKEFLPYIILAGVILTSILSVVFLIVPWFEDISEYQEKTKESENLIENVLKPKANLLLNQDLRILDDNFKLVIMGLPEEQNGLAIMNTLEKMEKAYQVELNGISYGGSRAASAPASGAAAATSGEKTTLSLSALKDYSTLVALLEGFGKLLPVNEINSVRFTKGAEGTGEINMSFEVSFYHQTSIPTIDPESPLESLTDQEMDALLEIREMTTYPLNPVYNQPGKDNLFR